ncbi:MAG: hypothetical protein KAU03_03060, partial [Candidatus Altiarchaeales archaeon]|nr:hypothetical protein [Candidatus Altiarchaeales archaeon]
MNKEENEGKLKEEILTLVAYCKLLIHAVDDSPFEYPEVGEKFRELAHLFSRDRLTEVNAEELERFLENYWKKLITDVCGFLKYHIENRKTRGQQFTKILRSIESLNDEIKYEECDIYLLQDIYDADLRNIRDEIKEKLD